MGAGNKINLGREVRWISFFILTLLVYPRVEAGEEGEGASEAGEDRRARSGTSADEYRGGAVETLRQIKQIQSLKKGSGGDGGRIPPSDSGGRDEIDMLLDQAEERGAFFQRLLSSIPDGLVPEWLLPMKRSLVEKEPTDGGRSATGVKVTVASTRGEVNGPKTVSTGRSKSEGDVRSIDIFPLIPTAGVVPSESD